MSKPTLLTNFFVNRNLLWLFICSVVISIIVGVCVGLGWFKDSQATNRDYLVWDDPKTINYDKTALAKTLLVAGQGDDTDEEMALQVQIEPEWVMFLIYSEQEVDDLKTTSTPSGKGLF